MFLQSSNLYFWCSFLTICKGVQRRTTLSRHSGFLEDTWIRHKKVAPRDTLLETRILLSVAHILIDIKFNFLNFMYNLLQQFESFSFFYFSVLINIDEKIFFFFFQKLDSKSVLISSIRNMNMYVRTHFHPNDNDGLSSCMCIHWCSIRHHSWKDPSKILKRHECALKIKNRNLRIRNLL